MTDHRTFVIVGAGLAGAKAAEALRDEGFDGRLVLLGAEPHLPYERPPLSKGYLQGKAERDDVFVHPERLVRRARRRPAARARPVTGLDPAAHERDSPTATALRYDKLLLATGAAPRRLRAARRRARAACTTCARSTTATRCGRRSRRARGSW